MGNASITVNDNIVGIKPQDVKISLDHPMNSYAKLMTNWRLDKIKAGYDKFIEFRKRRNYKFITMRTFQELGFAELNSSRVLFNYFDINQSGKINIYMFIICAVWMSYAKLKQKILFLIRMFSLRDELRIYLHEMIYIFEQTISGFGRVFQKRMPSKEILRIVSKKAYVSADMDNNGYLTIDEIELWCFNNMEFKKFLMKFETPKIIPYDQLVFEDFPIVDFRCFIKESLNTQSELEYIMRLTKSYSLKQRKKVDTSTNLSKTFTSSPSPSRSIIQTPAERQILQLKSKEGGINKVTHSKNSSHANLQAQMLQQNDNNKIDLFPQNQKRKQDSMGGNFTNFGSQTQRASSIKDIMKNNQSLIPEKLLLKMNSKLQLIVKKRYLKNLDQQFDQEIQRRKNFRLMLKQNQRFLMDNEEQENELQQKRKTMKKSQVSYKLISYAKKLASEKKEQDSPKKIKINHGVVQVIHYEDKLRKQSLQNSRLLKNQSQKVQFDEVEDSPKFMSLEKIQSAQPLLKNLKNFRPMTARQRIEVDFDEMIINQNQVLNDQLSQKNSSPQSSLKKEVLNDMELCKKSNKIIKIEGKSNNILKQSKQASARQSSKLMNLELNQSIHYYS